jgi:hypothetical protein
MIDMNGNAMNSASMVGLPGNQQQLTCRSNGNWMNFE